jgi:hypothetical protein
MQTWLQIPLGAGDAIDCSSRDKGGGTAVGGSKALHQTTPQTFGNPPQAHGVGWMQLLAAPILFHF